MANKLHSTLITLIVILAVSVRLYSLGNIPSGLTVDEADIGYDAYSLIKTGRDQWGEPFPIVGFRGFGDYRPVLYTYLVIPSFILFGVDAFSLRLPSVLFGIFSVGILYLLIKKIFNRQLALMAGLLMAISPWAIGMSRLAIESNVAIFFLLLGIYLLTFIKKRQLALVGAAMCFAATLYLYTAYTLFIPMLIVVLLYQFRNYAFNNKKPLFAALIFTTLLLAPFFQFNRAGFFSRASTEGFLVNTESLGIIQNINEKRGGCMTTLGSPLLCRLAANKAVEFSAAFVSNYLHHFSIDYLYLYGTPVQRVILPEMGLMYIFELPLLIFGALAVLKKSHEKNYGLLLIILFIAAVPSALTANGNFSRFSMALPFFITIEAIGLSAIFHKLRPLGKLAAVAIIVVSAVFFVFTYFTYFGYKHSTKLTYKELSADLQKSKNSYDKIYVSSYKVDSELHVYYLYYTLFDPVKYQNKIGVGHSEKTNGWTSVDRIDNIYFVSALPEKIEPTALYIAAPEQFPQNIKSKKTINNLSNGTIFLEVEGEELLKYKTN